MAQGYFLSGPLPEAVFDMFFRKNPFDGGYAIFAGISDLVRELADFSFTASDIEYLAGLKLFTADFLDYLSRFRFKGSLYAPKEGEIVFK